MRLEPAKLVGSVTPRILILCMESVPSLSVLYFERVFRPECNPLASFGRCNSVLSTFLVRAQCIYFLLFFCDNGCLIPLLESTHYLSPC